MIEQRGPGIPMVEVWRGDIMESIHSGHAVICGPDGEIEAAWGDPEAVILPRSSSKMIQALPLVESGAAAAVGLTPAHLALACASHNAAEKHTAQVEAWLAAQHLSDADLLCGAHPPWDREAKHAMIRAGGSPSALHNNCSGKHAGFLTLGQHLGAGPDYVATDHPVQSAVRAAFEDVSGEESPGFGVDGCSAPNFATTVHGLARAMSVFATAPERNDPRARACVDLTQAMIAHPDLVAGDTRPCTELMRAADGQAAIKFGADGVFTAILPTQGRGVAVKISDGATRAVDCVITALLVRLGVLNANHPIAIKYMHGPIRSVRGDAVGRLRPTSGIMA